MPKKWLWCVAAVIAAAIVWNEYRLYSHREPPTNPQVVQSSSQPDEVRIAEALPKSAGGEEESEVTVIDLTWLQRQTPEPPVAETEEPATLPTMPEPRQFVRRSAKAPNVAQFEPHSADGGSTSAKFASMWTRITSFVWNVPAQDGSEECEPLQVMPRLMNEPRHCPENSVCPYLNGTAGHQYKR